MRRLEILQPVLLRWPRGRVEAVAVAAADRSAWIEPARHVHALDSEAELEFDHRGTPVLLRGVAQAAPAGGIRFTSAGAGHLTEPRKEPRLPLVVPVVVTGAPAGPRSVTSVDLSAGGALLEADGLGGPGTRLRVELRPGGGTPIALDAEVVRSLGGRTAVRFTGVDGAVGARLRDTVLAVRRALVTRALARTDMAPPAHRT